MPSITRSGQLFVLMKADGQLIDSLALLVHPGLPCPRESTMTGPGVSTHFGPPAQLVAGRETSMKVEFRDAYGNLTPVDHIADITLRVAGGVLPKIRPAQHPGQFAVTYVPRDAGNFDLELYYKGDSYATGRAEVVPGVAEGIRSHAKGDLRGCCVPSRGVTRRIEVEVCDAMGNRRVQGGDTVKVTMEPTSTGMSGGSSAEGVLVSESQGPLRFESPSECARIFPNALEFLPNFSRISPEFLQNFSRIAPSFSEFSTDLYPILTLTLNLLDRPLSV